VLAEVAQAPRLVLEAVAEFFGVRLGEGALEQLGE
jgi:hypothetical protein